MRCICRICAALPAWTQGLIVALGPSLDRGRDGVGHGAQLSGAILQAALNEALPAAHIAVINRGVGGQDAPEEMLLGWKPT